MMPDKELLVCFAATARLGLQPRLEANLTALAIPWHFEPLTFPNPQIDSIRIGPRLSLLRKLCEGVAKGYKRMILCDAWDILPTAGLDEMCEKIDQLCAANQYGVTLSAERNLWPDPYLEPDMPVLDSPWRYSNGGMLAGTPDALLRWANRIKAQPHYCGSLIDQSYYNTLILHRNPVVMDILDTKTVLSYTMVCDRGELAFCICERGLRPVNTLTKELPAFIHMNGKYPISLYLQLESASRMMARSLQVELPTSSELSQLIHDVPVMRKTIEESQR